MIYRRFGYLQARLLVEKQDDLRQLEMALGAMDNEDDGKADVLKTRYFYNKESMKERKSLMEQIEKTWLEYCEQPLPRRQSLARSLARFSVLRRRGLSD
jgi:uncharacterized protein YydD (DUF2326 family)